MSMVILGGNQRKAERIAHDIVKDLTVMDIDFTIAEGMGLAGEQRLCTAIDEDFPKNESRLNFLHKEISAVNDDVSKLLDEFDTLRIRVSTARQQASFALGYAAALRLLGTLSETRGSRSGKPKGKRR